jgi:hypothetical protein
MNQTAYGITTEDTKDTEARSSQEILCELSALCVDRCDLPSMNRGWNRGSGLRLPPARPRRLARDLAALGGAEAVGARASPLEPAEAAESGGMRVLRIA